MAEMWSQLGMESDVHFVKLGGRDDCADNVWTSTEKAEEVATKAGYETERKGRGNGFAT